MKILSNKKVINNKLFLNLQKNLKDYYERRNKVLFFRGCGGLGDILMHRMIFEDFKKIAPEIEIHFACPPQYHDAVIDHPFIDKILDSNSVNREDYNISYNTTNACGRYESSIAPLSDKHRSDIWANHCGINLTKHDMHINLSEEEIKKGKDIINNKRKGNDPIVILSPVSAMISKNLLKHQIEFINNYLTQKNYCVIGLHNTPVLDLAVLSIPQIHSLSIREWMSVIYNADYVISVDTSTFHFSGGIKKPLMGIFTFADGLVYGKYFDFVLVQKHRNNGDWDCGPCYNWSNCPKTKNNIKPCLTEISNEMLKNGIDLMLKKWSIFT